MSLIDRCKDNLFPNILFNKNLQKSCQALILIITMISCDFY